MACPKCEGRLVEDEETLSGVTCRFWRCLSCGKRVFAASAEAETGKRCANRVDGARCGHKAMRGSDFCEDHQRKPVMRVEEEEPATPAAPRDPGSRCLGRQGRGRCKRPAVIDGYCRMHLKWQGSRPIQEAPAPAPAAPDPEPVEEDDEEDLDARLSTIFPEDEDDPIGAPKPDLAALAMDRASPPKRPRCGYAGCTWVVEQGEYCRRHPEGQSAKAQKRAARETKRAQAETKPATAETNGASGKTQAAMPAPIVRPAVLLEALPEPRPVHEGELVDGVDDPQGLVARLDGELAKLDDELEALQARMDVVLGKRLRLGEARAVMAQG